MDIMTPVTGNDIAMGAMMQTSPMMQMDRYVKDYASGSLREPLFTPQVHTKFVDTVHKDLVIDPVRKVADAEERFAGFKLAKGVEILSGKSSVDSALDADSAIYARDTYHMTSIGEEDSNDIMYRLAIENTSKALHVPVELIPARVDPVLPLYKPEELVSPVKSWSERISKSTAVILDNMAEARRKMEKDRREIMGAMTEASKLSYEPEESRWEPVERFGTIWQRRGKRDPTELLIGDSDLDTHTHIGARIDCTEFSSMYDHTTKKHLPLLDSLSNEIDDAMLEATLSGSTPAVVPYWEAKPTPLMTDWRTCLTETRVEMEDRFSNTPDLSHLDTQPLVPSLSPSLLSSLTPSQPDDYYPDHEPINLSHTSSLGLVRTPTSSSFIPDEDYYPDQNPILPPSVWKPLSRFDNPEDDWDDEPPDTLSAIRFNKKKGLWFP